MFILFWGLAIVLLSVGKANAKYFNSPDITNIFPVTVAPLQIRKTDQGTD